MVHFLFLMVSFFILGACVGSFCGVLLETEIKRPFWTGRSQCLSCHKQLAWYEMIPLFSYVFLHGKCRGCKITIPHWVFFIEIFFGLVWMLFGTLFVLHGFAVQELLIYLLLLSMILLLAFEDLRSFTIPDRFSGPMILATLCIIFFFAPTALLPTREDALFGALLGMLFYLLQMMVPALLLSFRKGAYFGALHIIFVPLFFPFWLLFKGLLGEKRADMLVPSVSYMDNMPTWVGGGDVRLGILLGLIIGPLYFWWVVGIGYTIGTFFWMVSRIFGKNLNVLPVAPLLFCGFCASWLIILFS